MNKKPFLLRSFFALVVVVVFVASMFPLTQSDFYKTLEGLVENPENPELQAVIADARALQKQDEVMYESAAKALEEAAEKRGVSLIQHVKPLIVKSQKLINNSDVISLVRKNAAGSIRLGIDLNGGAEFMLLLEPQDKNVSYDRLQFDRFRDTAIETLRKRLESQNIFETEISPSGQNLVSMRVPLVTKEEKANLEEGEFKESIIETFHKLYEEKENEVGPDRMRELERMILIRVIDNKWMDHIDAMDQLKSGIGLRGLGGQDPAGAYAIEGFDMFEEMTGSIKEDTVRFCYNVTVETNTRRKEIFGKGEGKKEEYEDDMGYREEPMDGDVPEQTQVPEREKKQETYKREQPKVGRNDPCPCGSGKKYKHCCGRNQ